MARPADGPEVRPQTCIHQKPTVHSDSKTIRTVRSLLLLQIAGFVALASIHFGLLMDDYRQPPAGATELVIVASLIVALLLTWGPPALGRRVATAAQLFAILGVLVGLVTMTLGVERGT